MRNIKITKDAFSYDDIINSVKNSKAGAVVVFIGTVRDDDINELEYELYKAMAIEKIEDIVNETMKKYDVLNISVIHRTGKLRVDENVVGIAVSSPHRKDSFDACEYLIDEIKKEVPIWKKEISDISEKWI